MSCSLYSNKSALSPLHLISVCLEKPPNTPAGHQDFSHPATLIILWWHTDDAERERKKKRMKMSRSIQPGDFFFVKPAGRKQLPSLQSMYVFVVALKGDQKRYRIWFLFCVSKWNTGRGIGHYVRSLRGDQGVLTPARSAYCVRKTQNYQRQ